MTGLADLLIVMSLYIDEILETKQDASFKFQTKEDVWNYVEETLSSLIYTVNQPMRTGLQSPFTNVSIYDDYFLDGMIDDYVHPNTGKIPNKSTIKKLQEVYLDVMNRELERTPVTFPVTSACFSVDDDKNIQDKEFLDFISKKNLKYGFINIYIGKSSTLSSCCFGENQKVLTRSRNGVSYKSFKELKEAPYYESKRNLRIFHNGSWVGGKVIKIPKGNKDIYKITTSNNKELVVTGDHINVTLEGEKETSQLSVEDYLMFNTKELNTYPEKDSGLTYEQGILIGAYLGDGSIDFGSTGNSARINFSLNHEKYERLLPLLEKALKDININASINLSSPYNNVYPAYVNSIDLANFIKTWTSGKYGHEKELNLDCLTQCVNFRKGILDGYYMTDGGNSNRIYTTSKKLAQQTEVLITSLGFNSVIDTSDRTDEKVIIRGEEFKRNYPLYCIRWYDSGNKRSMKDVYKHKNNSIYFKIESIEKVDYEDDYVYCFEMDNKGEPYFTLPNGNITHNCRLRSSKENEYMNTFGAGSSKIGSLGVVTINLPRVAFKHKKGDTKWEEEVNELVEVCNKINYVKRNIIKDKIERGHHPLYSLGFINIESQYQTVGINGFYEFVDILGKNMLGEGKTLGINLIKQINKENDKWSKELGMPTNTEQIPAESTSVKLANKDKLLGYNKEYDIYSNQFIPLTDKADLLDRVYLQGQFDGHFSGGSICHLNIENKIKDAGKMKELIEMSANKGVVYFAINYNLQECEKGHMSVGREDTCGVCGDEIINNYTRVVGFLTNTKNWNKTRREIDYPNREFYKGLYV